MPDLPQRTETGADRVRPVSLARRMLLASRPVSWINTAFPFAAAMLLTTGVIDARLVIGTLFFLVPYNLAMYGINDVFDYASDAQNPRKGGIEGALLPPETHRATLAWSMGLALPFVVALVLLGSPASWAVLAVSLFAVVAYSAKGLRFKEVPVLDSITSSTHFVSPAVYGLVLAGAEWTPQLALLLAAFFCWGMASHAFGAVQDVQPDRQGGIHSIATALGARGTVRLAIGLWAMAGGLMLLTPWPAWIAAIIAVPYIVLAAPFWRVTDEESAAANRGWRRFLWVNYVSGFVVTMVSIAWAMGVR
ncbi:prenyltransferase [Agrococcus sp. Ld7]|uniref:prenyltransferase n=1 Tax=Agrococcus sp. Ld7 TaxID=649148 RepID=UPI00386AAC69